MKTGMSSGDAAGRRGTTTDHHGGGTHQEAQEQRTRVAHEELRRMEIVAEEAETYPARQGGDQWTDVIARQ